MENKLCIAILALMGLPQCGGVRIDFGVNFNLTLLSCPTALQVLDKKITNIFQIQF